jgi:hypothetical protein
MLKQDRFLTGILIGIAVLVAIALALYFVRREEAVYQSEDTPAGVVHNFVLALHNGEYEKAHSYLAETSHKPRLAAFRQPFISRQLDIRANSLQIGETDLNGEEAIVAVTIVHASNNPFENVYHTPESVTLVQQDGQWRISALPYPYWYWEWEQPRLPMTEPEILEN